MEDRKRFLTKLPIGGINKMNLCILLNFMSKFETKVNGIMKIRKRVLSADLDKRGNIPRGRGPKPHWSDVSL